MRLFRYVVYYTDGTMLTGTVRVGTWTDAGAKVLAAAVEQARGRTIKRYMVNDIEQEYTPEAYAEHQRIA